MKYFLKPLYFVPVVFFSLVVWLVSDTIEFNEKMELEEANAVIAVDE